MRFQVPQFIEVEDKIFGPLTLKQFIYLAGSAGLSFIFYTFFPILIALPFIVPMAAVGLALAFFKINNKPFIHTIEAAFRYIMGAKLYVWRKLPPKPKHDGDKKPSENSDVDALTVPRLSESKLKEIAWSLDVHDLHERRVHDSERRRAEEGVRESVPK
jgi:hypothetical protein